ncbi:MAG: hypothetical protein HRT88_22990, partial [Lentisphaeraceae bacterium]|nr:hypothetical protein [Lentisphaeraceae bacterium]
RWVPLIWDGYIGKQNYCPQFADTKARKWRVELGTRRGTTSIQLLRFYYNAHSVKRPVPVQWENDQAYQ